MASLIVHVDNKCARIHALFFAIILAAFILVPVVLAVLGRIEWDAGPGLALIALLMFGWIYGFLIGWTLRLFRLSRFTGPLLEFGQGGFQDNWSQMPRYISWNDIEFSEWRSAGFTRSFRVILKRRSTPERLLSIFGLSEIDFPRQYLTVPDHKIAQFMLENAPESILR